LMTTCGWATFSTTIEYLPSEFRAYWLMTFGGCRLRSGSTAPRSLAASTQMAAIVPSAHGPYSPPCPWNPDTPYPPPPLFFCIRPFFFPLSSRFAHMRQTQSKKMYFTELQRPPYPETPGMCPAASPQGNLEG